MKLNATPRHYMPLPQNQSDDEESVPDKEDKGDKIIFKNSFDASEGSSKIKRIRKDEVNPKNLPMSPIRKFLFILSLITCVLFVLIFVFCVPCKMPQNLNELCYLTYEWRKVLHNMTFTAPLDLVDLRGLKSRLIILGYTSIDSGLIAIQETDGTEFWRLHLHSLPLSTSCNNLDVNLDGIPECLVIGYDGLLTAVDAKKGVSLWYLHNHSNLNYATSISEPTMIPDCDDDSVMDILISYNMNDEAGSHLAIVSGGTGQIIGLLIELSDCNEPASIKFSWKSQNEKLLVIHCTTKTHDELLLLSSSDICNAAMNKTKTLRSHKVFRIPYFTLSIQFYEITAPDNQFVIVLDGCQFMLLKRSHLALQTVWNTFIDADQHMRILADGKFINGSNQLVITSTIGYHSKILGLSLADGRKVWTIQHDNGTVTSAAKFKGFFGDTDGLLLKAFSSENPYDLQLFQEDINNSSESKTKIGLHKMKKNLMLLQENYIFVKCGNVPVMKNVHKENIFVNCIDDEDCSSKVYSANSTVLVSVEELGMSFDVLTATLTAVPASDSKDIIIKRFKLKNTSIHSRCTG